MYQQTRPQPSKAVERREGFLQPRQSFVGCGDNDKGEAGSFPKSPAGFGQWCVVRTWQGGRLCG